MYEYFPWMYECGLQACLEPTEARKRHWILGSGVTDACEPPCGCWKLNLGPLGEQQMLLSPEPSLQPHIFNVGSGNQTQVLALPTKLSPSLCSPHYRIGRVMPGAFTHVLSPFFWGGGALTNSNRLAGQGAQKSRILCLGLQACTTMSLAFRARLGIKLGSSCFHSKHLAAGAISPAPGFPSLEAGSYMALTKYGSRESWFRLWQLAMGTRL